MDEVPVERIFDRVPGPAALKRRLMAYAWLGKKEYPEALPLRRALAIAAAAVAKDRGVSKPAKVFDLITSTNDDLAGRLVVFNRVGGSPRLVDGASFPAGQPVIVIDLDELRRHLVAAGPAL